ncbi:MAG TPA: aldehyde dehydrogenase family protein [Candidatus Acidoferrum sp.]|nr:aldehyde dehydrogenase family protein [Candidatus Acidoferrum sp.]
MTAASSTKAKERELKTINPATEELISTYEIMTKEQISEKAKKAQDAFSDWKKDIQKRVDHIHYMYIYRLNRKKKRICGERK